MTLGVAPRARIRRDSHTQWPHLPWALEVAAGLTRGAATEDEPRARAALEARLPALRDALRGSPYYVRVLRESGLHPGDLRRLEDLRHFPALDRATLARHWEDVPTLPAASDECVVVKSSGTTGDPVNVLRDRRDCLLMWAVLRFFTERTGAVPPPRPRVVLLDALPGGLEYSVRLPLFHGGALHRVSVLRDDAVARLRRVKASVVFSDPEGLRWLLGHPEVPSPCWCSPPRSTCPRRCATRGHGSAACPSSTTTPPRRRGRSRGSASTTRTGAASTCSRRMSGWSRTGTRWW